MNPLTVCCNVSGDNFTERSQHYDCHTSKQIDIDSGSADIALWNSAIACTVKLNMDNNSFIVSHISSISRPLLHLSPDEGAGSTGTSLLTTKMVSSIKPFTSSCSTNFSRPNKTPLELSVELKIYKSEVTGLRDHTFDPPQNSSIKLMTCQIFSHLMSIFSFSFACVTVCLYKL